MIPNLKKQDKIIVSLLSIWTFAHIYFFLKSFNIKIVKDSFSLWTDKNSAWVQGLPNQSIEFKPQDFFYPFTKKWGDTELNGGNFNLDYYDSTEFFAYVVGAWLCFFLYKFLISKENIS